MTIRTRQKRAGNGRKILPLLLLGLVIAVSGLGFPSRLDATGASPLIPKVATTGLELRASAAPDTLESFVRLTMEKLSKDSLFKNWNGAEGRYYPLGPGTHGWLVNVMKGEQRIGYLIIAAKEDGGYVVSEYGAGNEGLPYSLTDLRQTLVQSGIITSNYSGSIELTPLYLPLLPLWEVVIKGKKVYMNAALPEVLPWNTSKVELMLHSADKETEIAPIQNLSMPQAAYRSGISSDPYDNLLWLTSPKQPLIKDELYPALLQHVGRFVFKSSAANEDFGAPLTLTGYQLWVTPGDAQGLKSAQSQTKVIAYAAAGPQGNRFLPLSLLQKKGSLHAAPSSDKNNIEDFN
ncbi:hypothetical protein [Paenibacillus sp. sgz500958]|uniref:hypothetical protein n=1 Tax=Paenibacillus sp. sgz500958 TaxID=3242475 RepID=UPI0036D3974C